MILSVHIPKTGGSSFRQFLQEAAGPRLMWDYGDWPEEINSAEGSRHNERRKAEMLAQIDQIRQNVDVIHGHYLPGKYLPSFPDAHVAVVLRDPYQHAVSTYRYAHRQILEIEASKLNPGLRRFRDQRMTIVDMLETFPNHQSFYLSGVPLEEMAMIGMTGELDRSIALFQKIFGLTAQAARWRDNVNPDQDGRPYEIPDDVRSAVEKYRAEDLDLYRRGRERFEALARHHEV